MARCRLGDVQRNASAHPRLARARWKQPTRLSPLPRRSSVLAAGSCQRSTGAYRRSASLVGADPRLTPETEHKALQRSLLGAVLPAMKAWGGVPRTGPSVGFRFAPAPGFGMHAGCTATVHTGGAGARAATNTTRAPRLLCPSAPTRRGGQTRRGRGGCHLAPGAPRSPCWADARCASASAGVTIPADDRPPRRYACNLAPVEAATVFPMPCSTRIE